MTIGKQIAVAVALALLAAAALLAATPLSIAFGAVTGFASLMTLAGIWSRRSPALLRLDWFVRVLRRPARGETTAPHGLLRRLAERCLPASLFSQRASKQRGLLRRLLRRLGVTWLASPVRRLSQACCLSAFLLLFFYVCWPYDARPAPPGQQSGGWRFATLDEAGDAHFHGGAAEASAQDAASPAAPAWLHAEATVYVLPESGAGPAGTDNKLSSWTVAAWSEGEIRLRPAGELRAETIDLLLEHAGDWRFYERPPGEWPTHYADRLAAKEAVPAELFLAIDPLVSLSTAIASRSWVWSLTGAGVILLICVLIPRGFCGYLCPLGTTIDLFDWAVAGRVRRFRVPDEGWWVHIKYYLLAGTLICATMGVLVSGIFSAIPVVTRAALFLLEPAQSGLLRGWHLVPAVHAGHLLSIVLFAVVLGLGFLRPRFWCKYVCPSGAVFSVGNLFRATERKVESSCIHCNKCIEICPFDAIKPDFTTRATDCTECQSCAGVCPTEAIKFVERWNIVDLKPADDPPTGETALGRRGFLSLAVGGCAAVAGGVGAAAAVSASRAAGAEPLVRPPGSVPEEAFLQMCIRCGECFKACPNNVLQAEGFQQGLAGLWTPMVVADWAGCESSCNACGQVCPTGAIRELPMEEKRVARMGLAIVAETCLPLAGKEACDLCVKECHAAGYDAIEFQQVGTLVDDRGMPIADSGFLAPVVLADACVGCGLCQTRCYAVQVKQRGALEHSAIVVRAGEGREDRLLSGSYREERQRRLAESASRRQDDGPDVNYFIPEQGASPPVDPFSTPPVDPAPGAEPAGNPFDAPANPFETPAPPM
ncbi:MAG: 4Fe-4S binding protein [Planctomycetales bacterium]|nr:4Fe-4S binding protein [Planctomycetales bacterium]